MAVRNAPASAGSLEEGSAPPVICAAVGTDHTLKTSLVKVAAACWSTALR